MGFWLGKRILLRPCGRMAASSGNRFYPVVLAKGFVVLSIPGYYPRDNQRGLTPLMLDKTPRIGPPQSVISGCGSGSKKLYGRCQGSKSASVNMPPHAHPYMMWPSSWTVVMTHQDATSKAANLSRCLSIGPAPFWFRFLSGQRI